MRLKSNEPASGAGRHAPQSAARRNALHGRSRRRALQRLAGGTALVALAACGRRDDPHGPLDFWAMGREAEVVSQLLPAFHARYPNTSVRVQQLPWTAAHEKLLT